MVIIIYDINSKAPDVAWSPSTWKIRYCLNFKGLEHKTEWIEFPDLEPLYARSGVQATVTNADGSPRSSVPLLHDTATGTYVTDSQAIAEYLDRTYPSPPLFPHSTLAIQSLVETVYFCHIRPMVDLIMPAVFNGFLNPPSDAYYRMKRRGSMDVVPIVDVFSQPGWIKFRQGLEVVDEWYGKSNGQFLMGNDPVWADFVVGGALIWLRVIWGKESKEWKDICSWNDGRWGQRMQALDKYAAVM